jgi:hypothetical protein
MFSGFSGVAVYSMRTNSSLSGAVTAEPLSRTLRAAFLASSPILSHMGWIWGTKEWSWNSWRTKSIRW